MGFSLSDNRRVRVHVGDPKQLFTNYLLAQQKLIEKHRHGAKVTKRYDRAQTPYQRFSAHTAVTGRRSKGDGRRRRRPAPGRSARPGSEAHRSVGESIAEQRTGTHPTGQQGL